MVDGTGANGSPPTTSRATRLRFPRFQPDTVADAAVKQTTFSGYDAFGWLAMITPADGALRHPVTLTYGGVRSETRTFKVGTGTLNAAGTVSLKPRFP